MKAKLEVNQATIKKAIAAYFAKMGADENGVKLHAGAYEDMYGYQLGHTITAEVEIDVGEPKE